MILEIIHNLMVFVKYILNSNIINFALMIWFFVWVFKRYNLISVVDRAITSVKDAIESSDYNRHKAENMLKEAVKTLKSADYDVVKIKKSTEEQYESLKNRINSYTKNQIERVKENCFKVVETEEQNASKFLTRFTVEKSVESATNKLIAKFEQNPYLHNEFIEKSLECFERSV